MRGGKAAAAKICRPSAATITISFSRKMATLVPAMFILRASPSKVELEDEQQISVQRNMRSGFGIVRLFRRGGADFWRGWI